MAKRMSFLGYSEAWGAGDIVIWGVLEEALWGWQESFLSGVSRNRARLKIDSRCTPSCYKELAVKPVSTNTALGVLNMIVVTDTNAHAHAHMRKQQIVNELW